METITSILSIAVLSAGLFAGSFSATSSPSSADGIGDCPPRQCDCVRDPETGQCRPPEN